MSQGQAKTKASNTTTNPPRDWTEELQTDLDRIVSVGEECISVDELKSLLLMKGRGTDSNKRFNLYDGFEPSGRMHIAQGVFKAMNVNKCTMEGTNSTFIFWVADWFALMNDKMGGDLEKIRTVGHYLIEVWKAAGMDLSHVVFKWASEEITTHADKYWPTMLDVARRFNVTRIKKCCQIMGRLEGSLTAAQILYPLMQCTDVFFLQADICQLGVDQRKVNMLAREYCDAAGRKYKPIILSHHMLYGLKAGQEKMSKSDPDSAIFMEDTVEDVERKIMKAYCPSQEQQGTTTTSETDDAGKASLQLKEDKLKNPCLDYIQNIIFSPPGATFTAGATTFEKFDDVRSDFLLGTLSEEELKRGLIDALNALLEPVRTHFSTDERAKELLSLVQQYKKESLEESGTEKLVRRLNLLELNKVSTGSHLVFAPLPSANPSLQEAVDVLCQLRLPQVANDRPSVLFLSDWSAIVCNACHANPKAIAAYYKVLVASLKAMDAALMANVQVLLQSEAILMDPSNYWISVINAGRHFMLDDVMGSLKDSDCVGFIIARLMRVADVAGVEPHSIALSESDESLVMSNMIAQFFPAQLPGVTVPSIVRKQAVSIRLQPERASEALVTENDEYFLLDDPKVHGMSKMKKAFCEPGNIDFCPPIAIASVFVFDDNNNTNTHSDTQQPPTLTIARSLDNGGDKMYHTVKELESDFVQGMDVLHPGDVKQAIGPCMVQCLDAIGQALKIKESQAVKDLKTFQKKLMKLKKTK